MWHLNYVVVKSKSKWQTIVSKWTLDSKYMSEGTWRPKSLTFPSSEILTKMIPCLSHSWSICSNSWMIFCDFRCVLSSIHNRIQVIEQWVGWLLGIRYDYRQTFTNGLATLQNHIWKQKSLQKRTATSSWVAMETKAEVKIKGDPFPYSSSQVSGEEKAVIERGK